VSEIFRNQIVQRIARNFLDILILRLVKAEPMWGYKIKKEVETKFGVKIRHGALYPLLNTLENNGFLRSRKEIKEGRTRKIYEITSKGIQLVDTYHEILKEQIQMKDIKGERQ